MIPIRNGKQRGYETRDGKQFLSINPTPQQMKAHQIEALSWEYHMNQKELASEKPATH